MKKLVLGTFLTAAMLLIAGGIEVKAQETASATVKMTYVDYDNADTAYGEIAEGETAMAGYNKISSGSVGFGYSGWGVNYVTYIQVDASAIEGTIASVELSAEVSGSTDSKRTTTWGAGYNTSEWSAELTYNTADLTITTIGDTYTTSTKSASTFEEATFDITDAFTDDDDNIVTILIYETSAAGGYIMNPAATVTYYDASESATYTVKYVDEDGNEVKESATYTGLIGASITLTDADTEDVWIDDVKYVYSSDDASSLTIAEDGSTVVTVIYKVADIYSYTVVGSIGGTTIEIGSGSVYAGETGTCPFSTYLALDGALYSTSNDNSNYYYIAQVTPTADDYTYTISYSATGTTGIYYIIEGENIEGMTASTDVIPTYRCSGGTIGYATEAVTVTSLAPGKYYIVAATFQCSDANYGDLNFTFSVGDETVSTHTHSTYSTWPISSTGDEFEVTSTSDLVLDAFDGAARIGVDYLYIVQTEAYETSDDTETGISTISVGTSADNSAYYTLQGIRTTAPSKGIYIHNGKKVVIK